MISKLEELVWCSEYDYYKVSIEEFNMVIEYQNKLHPCIKQVGKIIDILNRSDGYNYIICMITGNQNFFYSFKENQLKKLNSTTKLIINTFFIVNNIKI